MNRHTFILMGTIAALLAAGACEEGSSVSDGTRPLASAEATPLDPNAIKVATGGTPEVAGNVVKVNFPRTDQPVQIDGWKNVPPSTT